MHPNIGLVAAGPAALAATTL